jgi:hypothetical protein
MGLSIITWEKKQLGNDVNKEKACTSLHWWFYNKDDSQLATVKALTHTHCSWIMRSFLKLLSWWSWREWLTENLFPLPICTYFFPFRGGGDSVRVLYSLIYESDYIEDKKNSILQVWSMQEKQEHQLCSWESKVHRKFTEVCCCQRKHLSKNLDLVSVVPLAAFNNNYIMCRNVEIFPPKTISKSKILWTKVENLLKYSVILDFPHGIFKIN